MLTLALLRHAKSSWDDPADDDFDRRLNARGQKAAPLAGQALADLGAVPSLVVCSSARRTRETLDLALPALVSQPKVLFEDKLYLASPLTLLEVVRDIPAGHDRVLMIGHNPGMHELALMLAGGGRPEDLKLLAHKFPTAALAVIRIERGRWRDVRAGDGTLQALWFPKMD